MVAVKLAIGEHKWLFSRQQNMEILRLLSSVIALTSNDGDLNIFFFLPLAHSPDYLDSLVKSISILLLHRDN